MGVSDSTFDSSICTLSGYYAKKFALKGSLNADNTITVGSEGYDSLEQIGAVYDNNGGFGNQFNPNRATVAENGNEGFFNDISVVGEMNPIGINAVNYCQCVAVAVNACKPPVAYAATPSKDTLNFQDPLQFTGSITGDLNDEYTSVDQHINEALELDAAILSVQSIMTRRVVPFLLFSRAFRANWTIALLWPSVLCNCNLPASINTKIIIGQPD